MSFLNKKILAAAVAGSLFAGSALAAPLEVTQQYYADEIEIPTGGLEPTASPALTWESGYNYSAGEIKYVRIELAGATFTGSPTPTVENGTVGAINGIGTNVITFSVTSGTTPIDSESAFALATADNINIATKGSVSATVSLYDQASQAQAGGETGRLAIGSYDPTVFLSFVRSYAFSNEANTVTADVSADPRFSSFTGGSDSALLNDDLGIELVDPDGTDGPQSATLAADGTAITLAELFSEDSTIVVEGNFSAAESVTLGGVELELTEDTATWTDVPAVGDLVYNATGDDAIEAATFSATFNPVANEGYTAAPLTADVVGVIRRNGLELQAPLAQVPPAWTSRLVLTNTGSASPAYSITVLGENGQTITTANTTGTVNPGTNVIDLKTVMTNFSDLQRRRGTIVVTVEATDSATTGGTIQGLYQIVNTGTGSISNHVLVRPGTN